MPDDRPVLQPQATAMSEVLTQAPGLLAEFGSPLFILSELMLRETYRRFCREFARGGTKVQVAYSYKTNYLPAVCAIFHQEGAIAEVVSGMEYSFARALGIAPSDIIFNGPGKTRADLDRACAEGALIVVDGFDELDALIAMASGKPARIGLRLDFGEQSWSRFGLRTDSGNANRALRQIASVPNLQLELLHRHAGTDHRDSLPYRRTAQDFVGVLREAAGLNLFPETLDFGGGFAANIGYAQFGVAIAAGLADWAGISNRKSKPLAIVTEPGRALVDPAGWLAASVMAVKDMPGAERAIVADAGNQLSVGGQSQRAAADFRRCAGPAVGGLSIRAVLHAARPIGRTRRIAAVETRRPFAGERSRRLHGDPSQSIPRAAPGGRAARSGRTGIDSAARELAGRDRRLCSPGTPARGRA